MNAGVTRMTLVKVRDSSSPCIPVFLAVPVVPGAPVDLAKSEKMEKMKVGLMDLKLAVLGQFFTLNRLQAFFKSSSHAFSSYSRRSGIFSRFGRRLFFLAFLRPFLLYPASKRHLSIGKIARRVVSAWF